MAGTPLELGQPGGPHIVVQDYRQANCLRHDLAQGSSRQPMLAA